MDFKNMKFGRTQLIGGILALLIIVTGFFMVRIAYNESIVDSYEAVSNPLPARSKIGILDNFWQRYTGGTRNASVTARDAQNARDAVDSSYTIMEIADVVLIAALVFVVVKVKH